MSKPDTTMPGALYHVETDHLEIFLKISAKRSRSARFASAVFALVEHPEFERLTTAARSETLRFVAQMLEMSTIEAKP